MVVGYGRSRDAAEALAAGLAGGPHLALAADVTDSGALAAVASRVAAELGGCDVLVNAAGVTRFVPHDDLEALDDSLIDEILRTNVRGAIASVRALRPLLEASDRAGGGVVVNLSSIAAVTGMGSNVAYCASKAALDSVTRSLARALAPRIRVVSVSPGVVDTDFIRSLDPAWRDEQLGRTPLGRLALPDEVAAAVVAVVRDLTFTTGSVLAVDGGRPLVVSATHAGRVAVVSGAARGIGRALAEGLASRGAHVVAVDVLDSEETAAAIAAAGGTCMALVADVGSPLEVARVAREVGRCDVLVNNAALLGTTPFLELDHERFRETLRVNLESQFLLARAFAPGMVDRRWGRIVNVASSSLFTSTPGLTAYMASKGGVLGLTSALANDLGPHGITVNAVSPGLTRTPGVDADVEAGILSAAAIDAAVATQAIPRHGTADDLVGLVLFLTGDDASFVTGQFLVADGGATRR